MSFAGIQHSRSEKEAAASLYALSNRVGVFSTSNNVVEAFGSDLDMKVFRKHWSLEKVFNPISHIDICSFMATLHLFAEMYFISVSNGFVQAFCICIFSPAAFFIVFPSKGSLSFLLYPNLTLVSFAKARGNLLTNAGGPRKTKMCYFAQGGCRHGQSCLFAHSEEEIGQPRAGNALMHWRGGEASSSVQPYVLTLRISNRQAHFCL